MRRMSTGPLAVLLFVGVLGTLGNRVAVTQEMALAERGPRFLLASANGRTSPVEIEAGSSVLLRQVVELNLEHPTVGSLLDDIARQTGLTFFYGQDVLSPDRPVTLRADSITVATALIGILLDAEVDVLLRRGNQVALVKRLPSAQDGTIVGQVTDKVTATPIVGATVAVRGTRQSAITDDRGLYRIGGLEPGSYIVQARYIGYVMLTASVTVRAAKEVIADFALEKSAQRLEELVTTGTLVPTEVKALPAPVSLIDASDIQERRPRTLQQAFRQNVPGAVSWDISNTPQGTNLSVRGASTLIAGGQMKVFIDGVEIASPTFAAVDPSSIERVEVIRGPQAATLYGSDAIGGVVQIFTKRGDPSRSRPQVNAEAAAGILQTPYAGFNGVLRQEYRASVRSGTQDLNYSVGGGYSRTNDWIPGGELSTQSSPSVFAGVHAADRAVSVDISGRYYVNNTGAVFNPQLGGTGFAAWTQPNYAPLQAQNAAVAATVNLAPTSWWQHTAIVGLDRITTDLAQTRPRLTFPGDTLLLAVNGSATKASIRYWTSAHGTLGADLSGSITAGFDHWRLPFTSFIAFGVPAVTGTIQAGATGFVAASRTITNNTGYFVQAQSGYRDALFLTGGLRAEENSDFGDDLGTPISPRIGLAYARAVRELTVKLRGSWGRAIRAPRPGLKLAGIFGTAAILPNPALGPERQHGWDTGFDLVFGSRGYLSGTYYDQDADNLIELVPLSSTEYQYQNVGLIENAGVELEGGLYVGPASLKALYAYTRARVAQLAPGYTGNLRPGDQTLSTPKHTAAAFLSVSATRRTTLSAGLTYVGGWTEIDNLAYYSCLGGTGTCRNDTFAQDRSYLTPYPAYVKLNAGVTQQILHDVAGFVSVDNLTNNQAYEVSDLNAVWGRVTTIGLRFQR